MYRRILMVAIIVLVLSFIFLRLTAWFASEKSITFDETYYLSCSLQSVHEGKLDRRISSVGVAPLSVMLNYIIPLRNTTGGNTAGGNTAGENRPEPWKGKFHDKDFIKKPRAFNSVLFGVSLIVLVTVWLYRRQGLMAAVFGGTLVAFSPTLLANGYLATTDSSFAFFGTLGIAVTAWYFNKPSRLRFCLWAISIAAAMSSKYSGVFLLPTAGILLFLNTHSISIEGRTNYYSKLKISIQKFAILLSLILPIWWGVHLFTFTGPLKTVSVEVTPDYSPWVRALGRGPLAEKIMDVSHTILKKPAPIVGVVFQYFHNQAGHTAFLMGERNKTGWWYFFPCAFVFKSTPSELILSGFLIVILLYALRSPKISWKNLDPEIQAILLGVMIFSGILLTANINIGQRYLIILYPLLIIAGVDRLFVYFKERQKQAVLLGAFLAIGQITSSVMNAPNHLAYFNSFCGGSENGWHLLVDSSIDWGQDLPALEKKLANVSHEKTALCYFGTADPGSYGIHCDEIDNLSKPAEDYEYLAISVSCLQGLYVEGDDPFQYFRPLTPKARAGHSIFLFSLDTPEKKKAFAEGIKQIETSISLKNSKKVSE